MSDSPASPAPRSRVAPDHRNGPTAAEVARWVERHERDSIQAHRDLLRMIQKLDDRTDRISTRVTVIFAVVSVLWSIFLVVVPILRTWLGLSNGA